MDFFEALVKTLLEEDGFWVRQSFKVNLTKGEKRRIGKPSIPRPELDLLALKPKTNELFAIEVKSHLDSPGVRLADLEQRFKVPEGRYKLLTSSTYRRTVFARLTKELGKFGMLANGSDLRPKLGMVVGKVYRGQEVEMSKYLAEKDVFFWGPSELKCRLTKLATKGYENEPSVLAAKVLLR